MNSENLFDFYTEVQKHYRAIFPKKEEGLVVFLLYQKITAGSLDKVFSHDTLIDTIEQVHFNLHGKVNKNNTPSRNNDIIHRLLEFYLLRISKGYALRTFAEDFCKLLEAELDARFNPSQIELQFILFSGALKEAISEEEKFLVWYNNFFDKSKNQMKKQVEVLHNTVERTINELNVLYSSESTDFISRLREMDLHVQSLGDDAKKLGAVFVHADTINEMLNTEYEDPNSFAHKSETFREKRKFIRTFFTELGASLQEVSLTIDKIKPQLERLYSSFDQRDLDRKLEKYVDYAFRNSRTERNELNKDELILPEFISSKFLINDKIRFLFPVHYDLSEQPEEKVRQIQYDEKEHERQFAQVQEVLIRNQKAVKYCNEVLNSLRNNRELDYVEFLFHVLEKEESIEIALKTTHLVLRTINKDTQYKTTITNEFLSPASNKHIAIWKTILQYTPS